MRTGHLKMKVWRPTLATFKVTARLQCSKSEASRCIGTHSAIADEPGIFGFRSRRARVAIAPQVIGLPNFDTSVDDWNAGEIDHAATDLNALKWITRPN